MLLFNDSGILSPMNKPFATLHISLTQTSSQNISHVTSLLWVINLYFIFLNVFTQSLTSIITVIAEWYVGDVHYTILLTFHLSCTAN